MKTAVWLLAFLLLFLLTFCNQMKPPESENPRIREVIDTIGFAHLDWQMDSVVSRINSRFKNELEEVNQNSSLFWKAAICPHDDYTYASWLYPAVLKNVKSKTLIIFGVAHKAALFQLNNRIVFDSFDAWKGPYGDVRVSSLRNQIIEKLPKDLFVVHDSMQMVEHSVESMIPFLQEQNPNVEIISILVPFMSLSKMNTISLQLANAIHSIAKAQNLNWGRDFSILITTDAVHYGDEDWSGLDLAPFGTDSPGTQKALEKEKGIIESCFTGELTSEKANLFFKTTVNEDNFKEYKWTWCGRYSVPLGLKVAGNLQKLQKTKSLNGVPLGYQTTIDHPELPVKDLGMGKTAIATNRHWVGFTAVGFN
ncbi:AmmeMemoRadiSam system protein B [Maribellus maritimus]|uniref:AmmeMemoRadiSam system protein B n=1 Tax=Maribellus maritimus TaxID=2870838 RepID=UPI001EECE0E9|nr:AmmeMemoRadiSam system protein B [Maribellus maritimus]MCG6188982.1 AmmeMemoRadiSam system protein B [Maribellus maritimus]